MVLETIDSPKITVGGLQIEEKSERDLPFDPKRDLSDKDWGEMFKSLAETLPEYYTGYLRFAVGMIRIKPELKPSLKLNEEDFAKVVKKHGGHLVDTGGIDDFSMRHLPTLARLIELNSSLDRNFFDESLFRAKRLIEEFKGRRPSSFLLGKSAWDILYPNNKSEVGNDLTQDNWERIEIVLRDSLPSVMLSMLTSIRISYPEQFLKYKNKIPWEKILDRFELYKQEGNWNEVAYMAGNMLILEAEEVKIGETGLEIKLKQSGIPALNPTMPEERSF